jgi:hypothetical protein
MLEFLRGKASDRKLRLFVCACCRRLWHLLRDVRSRSAVEQSERFSDGTITRKTLSSFELMARRASEEAELRVARRPKGRGTLIVYIAQFSCKAAELSAAQCMLPPSGTRAIDPTVLDEGEEAVLVAMSAAPYALAVHTTMMIEGERFDQAYAAQECACTDLLRDIFGPLPFRPSTIDPAWLTPTVQRLAESIYHDRAFERLPILADAFEEAGCDQEDILNHLRQPGVQVRGCWALDLVLGKE